MGLINGEVTDFETEKGTEQKITLTVSNIIAEGVELQSSIKEGGTNDKSCAVNDINAMRHKIKATKPKDQSRAWFKLRLHFEMNRYTVLYCVCTEWSDGQRFSASDVLWLLGILACIICSFY